MTDQGNNKSYSILDSLKKLIFTDQEETQLKNPSPDIQKIHPLQK
ncbi:hypothetical protein L950_0219245 [Sphingobacterium sp. IITKGP-BTPF85]|nr:hypothetical protein L950_0219245 [Sphingobacterium sp. IITKGP-BTPF85]